MMSISRILIAEQVMGQKRLAVVEDNELCEIYGCTSAKEEDKAGSIYAGRIERIVPHLNAAFVNIGSGKNGFLDFREIPDHYWHSISVPNDFSKMISVGSMLPVQILKSATGDKGSRLTANISLGSRLLVLSPYLNCAGVSKKITDEDERNRLKIIASEIAGDQEPGVIIRTAAVGEDSDSLRAEYESLKKLWNEIEQRALHEKSPMLLYAGEDEVMTVLTERISNCDRVILDGEMLYNEIKEYLRIMDVQFDDKIELHSGEIPLFDLYRVDTQIKDALRRQVWLKSGASIVVDETEALTAIDVNSSKHSGGKDSDNALFSVNCEAAKEIMVQIRLRDLGGIIIVDFIDMQDLSHRQALMQLLKELSKRDTNRIRIVDMTPLGLVEMTRKRVRKALSERLLNQCQCCKGAGRTVSIQTRAFQILRDVWRKRRGGMTEPIVLKVSERLAAAIYKLNTQDDHLTYVVADHIPNDDYIVQPYLGEALPEGTFCLKPNNP